VPQFVKRYAELGAAAKSALETYVAEVRSRKFPETEHTYPMADGEQELFEREMAALRRQSPEFEG
jgi:3-methyl-2-oxobutanoate hydroxymethyltransferase